MGSEGSSREPDGAAGPNLRMRPCVFRRLLGAEEAGLSWSCLHCKVVIIIVVSMRPNKRTVVQKCYLCVCVCDGSFSHIYTQDESYPLAQITKATVKRDEHKKIKPERQKPTLPAREDS